MARRRASADRTLRNALALLLLLAIGWILRQGGALGEMGAGPDVHGASRPAVHAVRVGAWNIEWCGKPERRSGLAKGVRQLPADLADYIAFAQVAVLAVAEIVADQPGPRSGVLDQVVAALGSRTGGQWDYVLHPGHRPDDQLTGLLWDRQEVTPRAPGVRHWDSRRDGPWRVPITNQRPLWARPPHALGFSAGAALTDFVVVPLHMKADYQGDFARQREAEARVLSAALPAIEQAFADADVVLIGDANLANRIEPAVAAFATAGLRWLNPGRIATHWQSGALDAAFVPGTQPEFVGDFEVVGASYFVARGILPEEFKRRCSDHWMVVTTVRVGPDDD